MIMMFLGGENVRVFFGIFFEYPKVILRPADLNSFLLYWCFFMLLQVFTPKNKMPQKSPTLFKNHAASDARYLKSV